MTKQIVVRTQVEGLHHWPSAPEGNDVSYLKNPHRHVFHVELWCKVDSTDRELEFMDIKHKLFTFFYLRWYDSTISMMQFGGMSCEDIAVSVLNNFLYASKCSVFEDGENGAVIER